MNFSPSPSPSPSPEAKAGLHWLLEQFVETVPGVTAALLASRDGMKMAWHGLEGDALDHLSAVISGILPLVDGGLRQITGSAATRHQETVVTAGDTLMFVTAAGDGAILTALTHADTDVGVVGYELGQLVQQTGAHLTAPARAVG